MTQITAAMVKELRERTGQGMMDCKKALEVSGGDIEKAIDDMRSAGAIKAAKKAGNIAAEGSIAVKVADDNKSASTASAMDKPISSFCRTAEKSRALAEPISWE